MSDLISRRDAIEMLEKQLDYLHMLNSKENPTAEFNWYGVNWARNTIADMPSAEPKQKTGKWQKYEGRFDYNWECSECGCSAWEKTDYCAHCGARMESKNENTSDTYDRE